MKGARGYKKTERAIVFTLALLVLLIGLTGRGVFGKFITQTDPVSEGARVAKWGVTVEFSGEIIADEYKTNDFIYIRVADQKAVAPGASGSFAYTITGSAEVSLKTVYRIDANYAMYLHVFAAKDGTTYEIKYYPVTWTVTKDGTEKTGKLVEIQEFLNEQSKTYGSGQDVSETIGFSWEWKFENTDLVQDLSGNTVAGLTYDHLDTLLMYKAKGYDLSSYEMNGYSFIDNGSLPANKLKVEVGAEQVD